MAYFAPEAMAFPLPKFVPVKQIIPDEVLSDIPGTVAREIAKPSVACRMEPGKTAAVLVGSRGIDNLATIVRATIDTLKAAGVKPFIIPAMGSHGGGIAERQAGILAGYGITEETMGVPVKASMETIVIGASESGIPVHIDKFASQADYVVPINRVKVHTDFKGPIESGLCKMMVIGIGKHNGCSRVHQEGFANFARVIPEVAAVTLGHLNVPFGVAILENGFDHTYAVEAVPGNEILTREPALLAKSKELLPRLYFDKLDVLVCDQIGKDISGAGIDPNITGRVAGRKTEYWSVPAPTITRIVVNRISAGSHGSAVGLGCADLCPESIWDTIDREATVANQIASCVPENAFTPMLVPTEDDALRGAIVTSRCPDWSAATVVRIRDTLHLTDIEVSESLLPYCRSNSHFVVPEGC
ncbi:MAG: lactate racemase domain-containing protein [Oscillospiraceae bacterium]|nr:lactate racemase domain-containing protein [Oscillospiraceae bacterium]